MSVLRKKLRDKSGVSIFMGLIFLLVCAMVGSVALTASTAASGKLSQQEQDEQDYLTVASAARLIENRICALTYTHKVTATTTTNGVGSTTSTHSEEKLTASDGKAVILEEELKNLCRILVEKKDSATLQDELVAAGKSFQISLTSAAGAPAVEWDTVHGKLDMDLHGKILVKLWLEDADATTSKEHNHMKIEFAPNGPVRSTVVNSVEDESTGSVTVTVITTTTCRWPEEGCTITKG